MAKPVAPRGEARARVLEAALHLFAEHGVSGTSLQMIADHIGVSKAAVYFQFRTKDEIVQALVQPSFDAMERFVGAAEDEPDAARRSDVALQGLVDLVLGDRRSMAMLHTDPALAEIVGLDAHRKDLLRRLTRALLGEHPTPADVVAMRVFGTGIVLIGRAPELAHLSDAELRPLLLSAGRRALGLGTA